MCWFLFLETNETAQNTCTNQMEPKSENQTIPYSLQLPLSFVESSLHPPISHSWLRGKLYYSQHLQSTKAVPNQSRKGGGYIVHVA